MKYIFLIVLLLLRCIAMAQLPQETPTKPYDYDLKYTVAQLKEDFLFLRKTLEQKHPRLYEYTPKEKFDLFFDSLYQKIENPLAEREFHFFLLPVINMVHCSHTKLMSSMYLLGHMNDYIKVPPFQAYFTPEKVYIRANFSNDTTVKAGAELVSVNDVPVEEIRKSFLVRMTREGNNLTFIYNRMNAAAWPGNGYVGLFPGLCDYPSIDSYKLELINPGAKAKKVVKLTSLNYNSYPPVILSSRKKLEFRMEDNYLAGILIISSFSHPYERYQEFIDSVFAQLEACKVPNLIIDLRGNLGGIPQETVMLLSYILRDTFTYFKEGNGYDDYKIPIPVLPNRFKGRVYMLIDGACRSSTGHFLAIAKYHGIATMIGEEACASYSCNDNGAPYTLPHSKLILQCSGSTYSVVVRGLRRGNGIIPDYTVIPAIQDIVNEKDVVLQFALEKTRNSLKQ